MEANQVEKHLRNFNSTPIWQKEYICCSHRQKNNFDASKYRSFVFLVFFESSATYILHYSINLFKNSHSIMNNSSIIITEAGVRGLARSDVIPSPEIREKDPSALQFSSIKIPSKLCTVRSPLKIVANKLAVADTSTKCPLVYTQYLRASGEYFFLFLLSVVSRTCFRSNGTGSHRKFFTPRRSSPHQLQSVEPDLKTGPFLLVIAVFDQNFAYRVYVRLPGRILKLLVILFLAFMRKKEQDAREVLHDGRISQKDGFGFADAFEVWISLAM